MMKYAHKKLKVFYKKLTYTKFLHNLHGQFSGFHSFIMNFSSSRLLTFLI